MDLSTLIYLGVSIVSTTAFLSYGIYNKYYFYPNFEKKYGILENELLLSKNRVTELTERVFELTENFSDISTYNDLLSWDILLQSHLYLLYKSTLPFKHLIDFSEQFVLNKSLPSINAINKLEDVSKQIILTLFETNCPYNRFNNSNASIAMKELELAYSKIRFLNYDNNINNLILLNEFNSFNLHDEKSSLIKVMEYNNLKKPFAFNQRFSDFKFIKRF